MTFFHQALEAHRERLNVQFQLARQQFPRLDGQRFLTHLKELVSPVYDAANSQPSSNPDLLLDALYGAALTLSGRGLFDRFEPLQRAWREVLANVPHLVALEPKKMVVSVSNLVCNLMGEPEMEANRWVERMSKAGKPIQDVESFKQAGVIMAWQCGYAIARDEALRCCKLLDPAIICFLLGLPPMNPEEVEAIIDRMEQDPWHEPKEANKPKPLGVLRIVGNFKGFGGVFLNPPIVTIEDGYVIAEDKTGQWQLIADAFGAMFRRHEGVKISEITNFSPDFKIDDKGEVLKNNERSRIEGLQNWASAASTSQIMAVTLADSHQIFLVG